MAPPLAWMPPRGKSNSPGQRQVPSSSCSQRTPAADVPLDTAVLPTVSRRREGEGQTRDGLTGEGEAQTHRPLHSTLSCHLEILTFTFDRVFASEGHWDSGTAHEQRPCPPDTSLPRLHDTRNQCS